MKKTNLLFLMVLLAGFFLRMYPVLTNNVPVGYDSYFHIRVADLIKDTGQIPSAIPWPETRPYVYPPLYHIILAVVSVISGLAVFDITRFLLPLISTLFIPATYLLVKKYADDEAALLASFFISINPYLISNSYDSPQIIAMFLVFFYLDLLMQKKYLQAGLLLGIMYFFSSMALLLVAGATFLFFIWKKDIFPLPKLAIFPAVSAFLWYLAKSDAMWCLNNSIAPYFLEKSLGPMLISEIAIICVAMIVVFSFKHKINDDFTKFLVCFIALPFTLLLSFAVTSYFHPWRMPFYIFFGFTLLVSVLISKMPDLQDTKFLFNLVAVFSLIGLFGLLFMGGAQPALAKQDYMMINWYDSNFQNSKLLAQHDVCANVWTLTGKYCMLDIYFECISNENKWFELENFYWAQDPSRAKEVLSKYKIESVMFQYRDQNEFVMKDIDADKLYTSWMMKGTPYQASAFYHLNK